MAESRGAVTALLQAVRDGRPGASDELLHVVGDELRKIARGQLRRLPVTDLLQPTALLHEAYIKLFGGEQPSWEGRNHFFWAAARAMHDILVDQARRRGAQKRGGGHRRVALHDDLPEQRQSHEVLAVSETLKRLSEVHPRPAEVVLLRFFGGLSHEEVAQTLEISSATARREWTFARAWLRDALIDEDQRGKDDA